MTRWATACWEKRLTALVDFEALKLAAGATLLSPYIPLLFMGEEYGETAPFLYFVSHGDPDLVRAVREGRKREFADFHDLGEPPDAESPATFNQSTLNWDLLNQGKHRRLWELLSAADAATAADAGPGL